jgi:hypothetical protein
MLKGHVDTIPRYLIAGWALDTDIPNLPVDVVIFVDRQEYGRVTANLPRKDLRELGTFGDGNHGFRYTFDPPLSILRSHDVAVCFALNNEPLTRGRFRIPAESDLADERLQPVLITTAGQPGFLGLMRSLALDSGIVAADSHAYGVRLLSYYAHALDVLVMPGMGKRIPSTFTDEASNWILGTNPYHSPLFETAFPRPRLLSGFFQRRSKAIIGTAFKSVVTEFYATVAAHQGKAEANLFAEQCDLFGVTPAFARLAFGRVREIVLLQDPRDAYCGYRALWSTSATQAMTILRSVCQRTIERHQDNQGDTLFLRCEDLLLRPETALTEVAAFLSINRAITVGPDIATDPAREGINRWRSELDATEMTLFGQQFDEYLRLFGYDVAAITDT